MAEKPSRPVTVPSDARVEPARSHQRGLGVLARVYWMMLGYLAPLLLAVHILRTPGFELTGYDLAYGLTILSLPAVRLADIRWLGGESTTFQPVTMRDGWKYAAAVLSGGLALWLLVHGVAAAGA